MADAIKQEAMAIPMNSDLDIITRHGGFSSFIYYGFSEENLDPSVRNEIQTILNGKGISLDIKKVKKYKLIILKQKMQKPLRLIDIIQER